MEAHLFIKAARWLSRGVISPERRHDKLGRNVYKTDDVLD
jgi:hypothetical protein